MPTFLTGWGWTIANKFTGDISICAKDGEKIVYRIYVVIESYVKKDETYLTGKLVWQ